MSYTVDRRRERVSAPEEEVGGAPISAKHDSFMSDHILASVCHSNAGLSDQKDHEEEKRNDQTQKKPVPLDGGRTDRSRFVSGPRGQCWLDTSDSASWLLRLDYGEFGNERLLMPIFHPRSLAAQRLLTRTDIS